MGRLDQTAALGLLAAGAPARDRFEPNDGGANAYPLYGRRRSVDATLDYWNDRDDVYRVFLRAGQRFVATIGAASPVRPALSLWLPGTQSVVATGSPVRRLATKPPGGRLSFVAHSPGWFVLQVRLTLPVAGPYSLLVEKFGTPS